jgi:hypothetical protein
MKEPSQNGAGAEIADDRIDAQAAHDRHHDAGSSEDH